MTNARLHVRVQARAGRDALGELRDGALVVRVVAPAVEGRANRAVCQLLAKRLRIAPTRLRIVRGQRGRDKLIEVGGLDQKSVEQALRRLSS